MARIAKGLTVQDVVARLPVVRRPSGEKAAAISDRQIWRWEKNVNEPGAKMLDALARIYGTTVDALIRRAKLITGRAAAAEKKRRGKAA
jgi:transcriptional regulator with XRE-family HTH domain